LVFSRRFCAVSAVAKLRTIIIASQLIPRFRPMAQHFKQNALQSSLFLQSNHSCNCARRPRPAAADAIAFGAEREAGFLASCFGARNLGGIPHSGHPLARLLEHTGVSRRQRTGRTVFRSRLSFTLDRLALPRCMRGHRLVLTATDRFQRESQTAPFQRSFSASRGRRRSTRMLAPVMELTDFPANHAHITSSSENRARRL